MPALGGHLYQRPHLIHLLGHWWVRGMDTLAFLDGAQARRGEDGGAKPGVRLAGACMSAALAMAAVSLAATAAELAPVGAGAGP